MTKESRSPSEYRTIRKMTKEQQICFNKRLAAAAAKGEKLESVCFPNQFLPFPFPKM